MAVVPATQEEAEVGESLEPGRLRVPSHDCATLLHNESQSETLSQKKRKVILVRALLTTLLDITAPQNSPCWLYLRKK